MLPIVHLDLRALITAGQKAVRATEHRGSPETIATVDRALSDLPVTVMDDQAERLLHDALRALALAEDAEEWALLEDAERGVSMLLHEPDGATLQHPAVRAVATLAVRASIVHGEAIGGSAERAAWERAYLLGLEALRATTGAIYGEASGRELDRRVTEFFTAVRRAVPYAALMATRFALVEAARAYELPVIGMRQPLPTNSRWQWARRVADAVFLFEVVPPLVEGHPYGSVAVQRTTRDGESGPVRYIPLGADEGRRRAVTEAQYRI
ncbi:hypothetical protein ABZ352_18770 [Streptomyces griseofuscus]|uniref:hypothetical protein n=1 Tax=Streptomyces griseofuscus TaxID=146922 RepID=UPI0033F648BD